MYGYGPAAMSTPSWLAFTPWRKLTSFLIGQVQPPAADAGGALHASSKPVASATGTQRLARRVTALNTTGGPPGPGRGRFGLVPEGRTAFGLVANPDPGTDDREQLGRDRGERDLEHLVELVASENEQVRGRHRG